MVPLSIRLILETNKKQNALKALARLKKLFDFELRGLAPIERSLVSTFGLRIKPQ